MNPIFLVSLCFFWFLFAWGCVFSPIPCFLGVGPIPCFWFSWNSVVFMEQCGVHATSTSRIDCVCVRTRPHTYMVVRVCTCVYQCVPVCMCGYVCVCVGVGVGVCSVPSHIFGSHGTVWCSCNRCVSHRLCVCTYTSTHVHGCTRVYQCVPVCTSVYVCVCVCVCGCGQSGYKTVGHT